jgi:hypothetical protein
MNSLNNRNSYIGERQCSSDAKGSSLALTHLARGVCIAIVAACVAWVPQARAVSFTGATSGIFTSPTGGQDMVTTGVNTKSFTWGTGYQSPPSSLKFTGVTFAGIVPEQTFSLGNLTYFNGAVVDGTQASSVVFQAKLAFTSPVGLTKDFDFSFNLINTPNTGTAAQNADSVFLSSLFPTTIFSVDGIDYTLKMGFGSVAGGGFSEVSKFSVLEGGSASANLIGTITASKPSSVPETGSTLALMAMAVVGLGGLRQYANSKQNYVPCKAVIRIDRSGRDDHRAGTHSLE